MAIEMFRVEFFSRLSAALKLCEKEVIVLVGAGGKSSLMYRLAEELAGNGRNVITTTTTRIWKPKEELNRFKLIISYEGEIPRDIFAYHRHVTCGSAITNDGKVVGVHPSKIEDWEQTPNVDYIIVEADGSRGKSFKAPAPYEPVIPSNTTLYIAMVGVDILGKKLNNENVHRPEVVAKLAKVSLGCIITPECVGKILQYYIDLCPEGAQPLIFINKVSMGSELNRGLVIASQVSVREAVLGSIFEGKFWRLEKG